MKSNEALLVPLLNPMETIKEGGRAQLGEPVTLQLGGLGIRDMGRWKEVFLVIAGDIGDRFEADAKPSRIFSWKPGTDPKDIGVELKDLNPEAIVITGSRQPSSNPDSQRRRKISETARQRLSRSVVAAGERTHCQWKWKLSDIDGF